MLKFAKETRESVKREAAKTMDQMDAAREALEAETSSKRQEIAAAEQKFIADSKVTEDGLKGIREKLEARCHFGRYGDVADIFIPTCRRTSGPRCCAFVQFSSPRDADCTLAESCHVINGREVPMSTSLGSFFLFPQIGRAHV